MDLIDELPVQNIISPVAGIIEKLLSCRLNCIGQTIHLWRRDLSIHDRDRGEGGLHHPPLAHDVRTISRERIGGAVVVTASAE